MASVALRGDSNLKQIKLGAGRVYMGQTSTTLFDGTLKFDTTAPATGWRDLGVIMQSVTLAMKATEFAFKSGLPSTRKKTFIIGRDGTIDIEFDEFNALMTQLSMGLLAPINKLGGSVFTVQAAPAPTATIFTLDAVTGINVGDELVAEAVTGSLAASNNRGLVQAIATNQITLTQALFTAPVSTWKVQKNVSTKLVFGGSDVNTYPLLFVVDLIGGKQVVYFFPKVSADGNSDPNFGAAKDNMKYKIKFQAYGQLDTDLNDIALASCFIFEAEV